jgi:hypothetical protein
MNSLLSSSSRRNRVVYSTNDKTMRIAMTSSSMSIEIAEADIVGDGYERVGEVRRWSRTAWGRGWCEHCVTRLTTALVVLVGVAVVPMVIVAPWMDWGHDTAADNLTCHPALASLYWVGASLLLSADVLFLYLFLTSRCGWWTSCRRRSVECAIVAVALLGCTCILVALVADAEDCVGFNQEIHLAV